MRPSYQTSQRCSHNPMRLICPTPLQWYGSIPFDLGGHLQHNLLRQDRAAGGLLHLNLSPQLAAALEESYNFERQRDGVPGAAQDLLPERQRLRALMVGVQAVADAYNRVLAGLSPDNRRLCRDRIRWVGQAAMHSVLWCQPPCGVCWQRARQRLCRIPLCFQPTLCSHGTPALPPCRLNCSSAQVPGPPRAAGREQAVLGVAAAPDSLLAEGCPALLQGGGGNGCGAACRQRSGGLHCCLVPRRAAAACGAQAPA